MNIYTNFLRTPVKKADCQIGEDVVLFIEAAMRKIGMALVAFVILGCATVLAVYAQYLNPDGTYRTTPDSQMYRDGTYDNDYERYFMYPDGTYRSTPGYQMYPDSTHGSKPGFNMLPDGTYSDEW